MEQLSKDLGGIIYSCYHKENRAGEECIGEHALGYLLNGSLHIIDGDITHTFKDGDMVLFRKNQLAKFIKQPANGQQFLAVTVILDKGTLEDFGQQQQLAGGVHPLQAPVLSIEPDTLLKHYFNSLLPLFDEKGTETLITHKKQEAILLLLRNNPSLKHLLFDFGAPGKVDLQAFMRRNYRYNVPLERMAYLTGRSLATFKRDFEKLFNISPNRWIQQQRLKDAYYLISEKKIRPSDVYLEVGFESLSHFSYAFKQYFGKNPSKV